MEKKLFYYLLEHSSWGGYKLPSLTEGLAEKLNAFGIHRIPGGDLNGRKTKIGWSGGQPGG